MSNVRNSNEKVYAVLLDAMDKDRIVSPEELRKVLVRNDLNPRYLTLYLSRASRDGAQIERIHSLHDARRVLGYRLISMPDSMEKVKSGRPVEGINARKINLRTPSGKVLTDEEKIAALANVKKYDVFDRKAS